MSLANKIIEKRKLVFSALIPLVFTCILTSAFYMLFYYPVKVEFSGTIKSISMGKVEIEGINEEIAGKLKPEKEVILVGKQKNIGRFKIIKVYRNKKSANILLFNFNLINTQGLSTDPHQHVNMECKISLWSLIF